MLQRCIGHRRRLRGGGREERLLAAAAERRLFALKAVSNGVALSPKAGYLEEIPILYGKGYPLFSVVTRQGIQSKLMGKLYKKGFDKKLSNTEQRASP